VCVVVGVQDVRYTPGVVQMCQVGRIVAEMDPSDVCGLVAQPDEIIVLMLTGVMHHGARET
jgi:hypothetical protein